MGLKVREVRESAAPHARLKLLDRRLSGPPDFAQSSGQMCVVVGSPLPAPFLGVVRVRGDCGAAVADLSLELVESAIRNVQYHEWLRRCSWTKGRSLDDVVAHPDDDVVIGAVYGFRVEVGTSIGRRTKIAPNQPFHPESFAVGVGEQVVAPDKE